MPIADIEARFGDFCLLLFFGMKQGSEIRGCVYPAEVAALSELLETTYMCGVEGVVGVLPEIRAAWGACGLFLFKEDCEAGYRALDLLEALRLFFVAAAESERRETVGFVPKRLLFGPSRGPPQFSRGSEAFERILAAHVWILSTHHVDDHIAFETAPLAHSAGQSTRALADILQIPLSNSKPFLRGAARAPGIIRMRGAVLCALSCLPSLLG